MLTKSEQRFVQNPKAFPKSQVWTHRCRINKKIKKFVADLKVIIEKNDELCLNLQVLDELLQTGNALQNSERSKQNESSDCTNTGSSILERFENW
ncbi:MAG: hypothetical protein KGI27_12760 [Thaumarchaeota archaeon]|nr:hypothetical protein [Nitrososphaerota archaeon]